MTVKRSHMVTRSYIEAWADDKGQVYVVDLESGERPLALSAATVVKYGYRTEHTTLDLEQHYSDTEAAGVLAFRELLNNPKSTTLTTKLAVIQFLDMHLERGRYADQAKTRLPIVKIDLVNGAAEEVYVGLGDRLALSKDLNTEALRLAALGLEHWSWRIYRADGLITGDGAVLLFRSGQDSPVTGVAFPISPQALIIIGDCSGIEATDVNELIAQASRRWTVGRVQDVRPLTDNGYAEPNEPAKSKARGKGKTPTDTSTGSEVGGDSPADLATTAG